jgi:hypothetical protein
VDVVALDRARDRFAIRHLRSAHVQFDASRLQAFDQVYEVVLILSRYYRLATLRVDLHPALRIIVRNSRERLSQPIAVARMALLDGDVDDWLTHAPPSHSATRV